MIAEKVALEGGRTFYVGGLVRDHILGRDSKDVDIEVHGITPEKLTAILESLGEVTKTGLSFGVFGLIQRAGFLSGVPVLAFGVPALLSCYFDLFSGFVQAYVFTLLSMVYIGNACPPRQADPLGD